MKTVTIYSTPSCHFCHMTKDYLTSHNVAFTDIDVASNTEARKDMVELTGQMGVPVIKIDAEGEDSFVIVGFNQKLLIEALAIQE